LLLLGSWSNGRPLNARADLLWGTEDTETGAETTKAAGLSGGSLTCALGRIRTCNLLIRRHFPNTFHLVNALANAHTGVRGRPTKSPDLRLDRHSVCHPVAAALGGQKQLEQLAPVGAGLLHTALFQPSVTV
jgi:hypothetical protein